MASFKINLSSSIALNQRFWNLYHAKIKIRSTQDNAEATHMHVGQLPFLFRWLKTKFLMAPSEILLSRNTQGNTQGTNLP